MLLGIVVALLSALWFAAAGSVQHSVTRGIAIRSAAGGGQWLPVLKLLRPILSSRVWWLGLSLNGMGFLFHAAALHLTSLAVVQATLSLQVMFAVPLASVRSRTAPLLRDWIATALVCVGIITLMAARGTAPSELARPGWVPVVLAVAASALIFLVAVAKAARRTARTALIGTAAGIGFSITATLITILTGQIAGGGWWAPIGHWHLYALACSGIVAAVVAQDAFASGSFPAALTAMTVADPVASSVWDALLFDRVPAATPMAIGGLTLAGALICAGVALLAYSPSVAPSPR